MGSRRQQKMVPFRLPEQLADTLAARAEEQGSSVQGLLEGWVLERLAGRGGAVPAGYRAEDAYRRMNALGDAYEGVADRGTEEFDAWLLERLASGGRVLLLGATGIGKTFPALLAARRHAEATGMPSVLHLDANDFVLYRETGIGGPGDGLAAGPHAVAAPLPGSLTEAEYLTAAAAAPRPHVLVADVALDSPGRLAAVLAAVPLAAAAVLCDQYDGTAERLARACGLSGPDAVVRVLEAYGIVPVRAWVDLGDGGMPARHYEELRPRAGAEGA